MEQSWMVQDDILGFWSFVSEHDNGMSATLAASMHKNYLAERVPGSFKVRAVKVTIEPIAELRS